MLAAMLKLTTKAGVDLELYASHISTQSIDSVTPRSGKTTQH
jgi:hypothetical protein